MKAPSIIWFRLDLRLGDNPALAAGLARGGPVLPVFIWAPGEEGRWPPGAASRWWLHQSLRSLERDLRARGSTLVLRRGPSLEALRSLARETGAGAVFFNRRHEPALRRRDAAVGLGLARDGLEIEGFASALLHDPDRMMNRSGRPYRVFGPFYRAFLSNAPAFRPLPIPSSLPAPRRFPRSLALESLALEPKPDWAGEIARTWRAGEAAAGAELRRFLRQGADRYAAGRDNLGSPGTSRLSPHLHFGEVSPRRVWSALARRGTAGADALRRQLIWREFAHHLLHHFPATADRPLRPEFARFPWRRDRKALRAWQRGRTGCPIVDAGMRELWRTGWMHNRARMIAASFLVKDLLISWNEGARWFWDTLVDADLANNTLGWQWVAGCGADAAPFFRIFNPALQAERHDPEGKYVGRWLPERSDPGYPPPIIDRLAARRRALRAFASLRRAGRPIHA